MSAAFRCFSSHDIFIIDYYAIVITCRYAFRFDDDCFDAHYAFMPCASASAIVMMPRFIFAIFRDAILLLIRLPHTLLILLLFFHAIFTMPLS